VQNIQAIQTREISSLDPTTIVVGRISGGTTCNIIPDQVELEGTIRYLYDGSDDTPQHPLVRMRRMVEGIAQAYEIDCTIEFIPSSYTVINDELSVSFLTEKVLPQIVDSKDVVHYHCMAGEDFSAFTNHNGIPGALIFVGTGN